MCLCVFSYKNHPEYGLILVFNRDEFLVRPTREAHFWHDHPQILAGRDLKQGGTWLGLNKNGRIAFITNYRDMKNIKEDAPSRGELTTKFLLGEQSPFEYLKNIPNPESYNGFNLVVGDRDNLYYYSNIKGEIAKISPGIHGISNSFLNTEWEKVKRKKQKLAEKTSGVININELVEMMSDKTEAPDETLPNTGVEPELEKKLSAPFIVLPDYGTVSMTVITISKRGEYLLKEQKYGLGGKLISDVEFGFINQV